MTISNAMIQHHEATAAATYRRGTQGDFAARKVAWFYVLQFLGQ